MHNLAKTDELLNVLRQCAQEFLADYDQTRCLFFLEAFEQTAQACEALVGYHQPVTIH